MGERVGPATPRSDAERAAHRMRALGLWGSRSKTPGDVVRHLVAVQSQEHKLARWSVAQRMDPPSLPAAVDDAFDRGELLRIHVLRPTWHYLHRDDLRWLVRFSGPRIAARYRRYWEQLGLDARRLAEATDIIAGVVDEGPCTRSELRSRLAARGRPVDPVELAAIVMHAELHMAVCSGPMRGRQHTYAAFDQRAGQDGPAGEGALELLARRYFTSRGPATVDDFAWWSGLPMKEARRGLDLAASYLEHQEDAGRRYAFAPLAATHGDAAIDLVQCYDEAVVSYRQSRDVLKTERVAFDPLRRLDGFLHLVLREGRLLGHWRPSPDARSIETRLADRLSPEHHAQLETRIGALRPFLDRGR